MPQPNDLSRSLVALDQDSTIIAVVELSQSSWLVAGVLPGIERQPRKKLEPSAERLLGLLHGWRDEAVRAGSAECYLGLVQLRVQSTDVTEGQYPGLNDVMQRREMRFACPRRVEARIVSEIGAPHG